MNDNSQLREQMWDLVYGLLDQDESRELVARIKSDPQAARLYAEVRLQADLVGYASKVEDSSLVLTGDSAAREVVPAASRRGADKAAALGQSRSGNMLAVIVAAALALLIGVGMFWPQLDHHELARNFLVIDVGTPRDLPGGLTGELPVRITSVDRVGQMAEGEATVYSADGRETYRGRFLTNTIGQAEVTIPGEARQPGAKLKVVAVPVDASRKLSENDVKEKYARRLDDQIDEVRARLASAPSSLTADLPVREEPQMQYYFSASPITEPGQSNQLAVWNLTTYSATPVPADMSGVGIADLAGTTVAEPTWSTDGSVATFGFSVPESSERRDAPLALRDARGEKFQPPLVGIVRQQDRKNAQALAQNDFAPYNLAKNGAADDRLPRGAAPLEAQIASAPPPAPPAPAKPGEPLESGQRESAASGYARASDVPAQQPAQPLGSALAANDAEKKSLQEVTKKAEESAASKGVTFEIPAEHNNRRLKAIIRYRGLDVAEKWIDSEDGTAAQQELSDGREGKKSGQSVAVDLPPEVSGPVEMQLYDSETDELLQRQVVVRESPRKLNVQVLNVKDSYAPGENVSLKLQFTDENGQPAPGTRGGVRLWNEQLVQSLGKQPLLLAEALQTASEESILGDDRDLERARSFSALAAAKRAKQESESLVENKLAMSRSDLKQADAAKAQAMEAPGLNAPLPAAPLPAAPLPDASAPVAETAKSGAQELGGEGFGGGAGSSNFYADSAAESHDYRLQTKLGEAETPALLASNSLLVQAEYEAAKRQAEEEREAAQAIIGRILLFGGIGAAALLGLLMLLKLPAKARVVVPSLAIAAASIVLGLSWIGVRPGSNLYQVALVDEHAGTEHAKSAAGPMATPAPTGEPLDQLAMDADTRDPAALGGRGAAGGASPAASEYGNFAAGGIEAANMPAPAIAPSDAPAEGAPPALFSKASPSAAPGAGGFVAPSGGSARGPAGRGGADREHGSELARNELDRQKLTELAEAKQLEKRKAATDPPLAPGKDLQEGIESRGGGVKPSFNQALPKSMRSVSPSTEPAPAEPPAATAPAAPSAPRPAASSKPAAAGAPASAATPGAAISPEFDKKDALREQAGKMAKGAPGDKPGGTLAANAADSNEVNRDKADRFGADAKRRSDSGSGLRSYSNDGFRTAGDRAVSNGAPASIYFNPRLIADDNGRATIEFTMPPVESEYRLLVDALGHGRIGSLQQVIEVRETAK